MNQTILFLSPTGLTKGFNTESPLFLLIKLMDCKNISSIDRGLIMAALDMFGNSDEAELSIKERQRCAAIVKSVKEYSLRQIAEKSYTSLVK